MKKLTLILITILLSSCSMIKENKSVVVSVSKAATKKYMVEIYGCGIYNISLLTDSIFNVGDTVKFSK